MVDLKINDKLKLKLRDKASKTKFSYKELAQVYREGLRIFQHAKYHRQNKKNAQSAHGFAMARVNKYIMHGGKIPKPKQTTKQKEKLITHMNIGEEGKIKEVTQTVGIEGGQILTLPSGVTVSLAPSGKYEILEDKPKEELIKTIPSSPKSAVGKLREPTEEEKFKNETPKEIKRKFPHITVSKNYSETEIAFLFKYISPVGYYEWHKLASNLIFNSKNWNAQQIFQVFSAPAYYLTDELSTAFLDTPIHELKIEKTPQIINNHFFVLQSNEINLVNYMFIDTETGLNDVEVVCHLSTKSRFIRSEGIALGKESKQRFMFGFNWNNLNAIRTNNISKAVNSPLWINKSKDYTFDELPRTYQQQFLIVVNLILFMNQEPDITVEYLPPSQTIPIQREMNRSGKFKPRAVTWIGKEFSERVIKLRPKTDMLEVKEAGIPRRPHWRRGHWHTVCQGFKRRQRKLKWFEPCYVSGKNR